MYIRYGLTYKDAVECAIIKQHWLAQIEAVRLVSPWFQRLVSGARTEREKIVSRYAHHRGHKSQKSRTYEPSLLLPTHRWYLMDS